MQNEKYKFLKNHTMKKLFIILVIITACSFFFHIDSKGQTKEGLPPITIAEVVEKQSVFADSLITLHNINIESCKSVLNYTTAEITDKSGAKIQFLSSKPYKSGETTDVTGRIIVLYQNQSKSKIVFIDNELSPLKDLYKSTKRLIGYN